LPILSKGSVNTQVRIFIQTLAFVSLWPYLRVEVSILSAATGLS
jgi:hypothetical protein